MTTLAIVQARMNSTRFPGKVMMDIGGAPMLKRVVERTLLAERLDGVLVATTTQSADYPIVQFCKRHELACFRGSEADVLDRYYQSSKEHRADVVVRITADCPLIDPEIIDWVVGDFFTTGDLDFAGNTRFQPRSFPIGEDVEVIAFDALERAWREDKNPAWREHVTPYIYRNPDKFKLHSVVNSVDYSSMKWAVDSQEDLTLVRLIYNYFGERRFSWRQVTDLLAEHPDWLEINRNVTQKHGWEL